MNKATLTDIVRLRLLVGALGEQVQPAWWPTKFLSEMGARRMSQLFPRTALRAALESVTLAARQEHDELLGGRSFHLFRLPAGMEARIMDLLQESLPTGRLEWPPHTIPELLSMLVKNEKGSAVQSPGPRRMGAVSESTG